MTEETPSAETPSASQQQAHPSDEPSAPTAPPTQETAAEASPVVADQTTAVEDGGAATVGGAKEGDVVEGQVIGWNKGGFHVVVGDVTAFCPRSEMEMDAEADPKELVDQTFEFRILRIEDDGKRVVLSRSAVVRGERQKERAAVKGQLSAGSVVDGKVASITDFGAFIELGGGVQGLLHVSELAHHRVEHPSDMLSEGQDVRVKVLKIEGRRISLSMRALEADPWDGFAERYPVGTRIKGKVDRTENFGALIEIEPGISGLLPSSKMNIPRDSSPARAFPPGKEVAVQVIGIDRKRRRISLGLEGEGAEGSRRDYEEFQRRQESSGGFNALASALQKVRGTD
ncbi:MAG: S1 RNA-binding domain-containing protein [Thermoanaerobaculia bacterium]